MAYILDASRSSTRAKFKDNDEQAVESRFGAGIFRCDLPQFRLSFLLILLQLMT